MPILKKKPAIAPPPKLHALQPAKSRGSSVVPREIKKQAALVSCAVVTILVALVLTSEGSPMANLVFLFGLQAVTLILLTRGTVAFDSTRREVLFLTGLPGLWFRRSRPYDDVESVRIERETRTVRGRVLLHTVLRLYWGPPHRKSVEIAASPDEDLIFALGRQLQEGAGIDVLGLPKAKPPIVPRRTNP